MADRMQYKIGIMGGTFDPMHIGHLAVAEASRESLGLEKVLFVPTGVPPHKKPVNITDRHHRVEMVRLAVEGNPHFEVSNIEVSREGYTYSVDTLQQLRDIYGEDYKMFFIIGADTVWDLLNWKHYEKVFRLCSFAVAARPRYDILKLNRHIEFLKKHFFADIHLIDTVLIDLSSTYVREKLAAGKSVRYLVPEPVRKYIIRNGLYHVGS